MGRLACSNVGLALLLGLVAQSAAADDTFFVLPVRALQLIEGRLPAEAVELAPSNRWLSARHMPYVRIEGDGEAYLDPPQPRSSAPNRDQRLGIRTAQPRDVRGTLFWPKTGGPTVRVRFLIPASEGSPEKRNEYLQVRLNHYSDLLVSDLPGAAWFRHEVQETRRALGWKDFDANTQAARRRPTGVSEMESTFDLISGERALNENLQLDRQLLATEAAPEDVTLESLTGITVREMDWQPLIRGLDPKKDPLAAVIPDDQHVVFFPSFAALAATLDGLAEPATPLLQMFESRSESREVRARYERQLGLSLTTAARLVGPQLIRGIAITGSDPYVRTGTDVAVLFEARDATVLKQTLATQIAVAVEREQQVESKQGELAGVGYSSWRSPDRRICTYLAQLDQRVVVTNSPAQLRRLIDVAQGRSTPLAALPEFTYFRNRYPLGVDNESALVVISDKTIRRWCGPRWRIGASRRIRAAAVMAEYQAAHLDRLVAGTVRLGPIPGSLPAAAGPLSLASSGIMSSVYGTLDFQTPILELPLERVTAEEARIYSAWRNDYQRYWRNFFDPIAARIHVEPRKMEFDLTVLPLIDASSYRQVKTLAGRSRLAPDSGDPHMGSLLHFITAIDRDAPDELIRFLRAALASEPNDDPLGWLGRSISFYVDDDPAWAQLANVPFEQLDQSGGIEYLNARLPITVRFEVADQQKLAPVLKRLRDHFSALVAKRGTWSTVEYRGQSYSKYIGPPRIAGHPRPFLGEDLQLLSWAGRDQWLITFNEALLRRAIDRSLDAAAGKPAGDKPNANDAVRNSDDALKWLGDHQALAIDGRITEVLGSFLASNYARQAQIVSWNNLPILTEWKRHFPESDPVELHQRFFQMRLECPGGGTYRWNEEFQTMESSVFGHPGQPRTVNAVPAILRDLQRLRLGLTFENDGLRARGSWQRRE